jgi:hypothetical protein
MTEIPTKDGNHPEMDAMLHDYFKSEMPRPWPGFKAPAETQILKPAGFWSRNTGRLALAACIAALMAGYFALAGNFPRTSAPNDVVREVGPNSAKGFEKPRHTIEE